MLRSMANSDFQCGVFKQNFVLISLLITASCFLKTVASLPLKSEKGNDYYSLEDIKHANKKNELAGNLYTFIIKSISSSSKPYV